MRMMKRCQVESFTTTLRSVSARIGLWESSTETAGDVAEGIVEDANSRSRANPDSVPSVTVAARASRVEERMNVAETDVISRTASVQWGVHGRIACQTGGGRSAAGADADVDINADVSG